MLSQSPIMLNETIEDNLTVGCRYSNKEIPSKEALQKMMEKLQLKKDLSDNAHQCSLGEKQRIALGRVLLMNPKVYLMDEPSASLDSNSESIIMDLIINHTKENKQTLIMVTHNQQVADQYAHNVVRLEAGNVQ
jgi:putative ABC transport system ATP-binding protein